MKQNSSTRVREMIEEGIVTGRYPPGMRLDETGMAERFEVSRTPLREALFQLASAGIVEMTPRRGTVVTEITPPQLVEMFEVMAELEAMCGRLAARRISSREQEDLVDSLGACKRAHKAMDTDRYYFENQKFHQLIYAGSHNVFLQAQVNSLHRRLSPYRRLQLRESDRMPNSFDEQQGIVEAVIAGQPELAAQRLRTHILEQGERSAGLLASLTRLRDGKATREARAGSGKRQAKPDQSPESSMQRTRRSRFSPNCP